MGRRLEYIDIMRGIAILLVVFEHCIASLNEPLARFILSFHMPLFFFISGFCMKPIGGGNWYIKKAKAILIPQITLGVVSIISILLFDVLLKKSISISEVNYLHSFGGWFLITLFLMEMILGPIITFVKNRIFIVIIALSFCLLFCLVRNTDIQYIQQTLAAVIFGLLGFLFRPLIEKYEKGTIRLKGFGWLALLIVIFLSQYNEPVGMYINQYGNKILFLLTAIIGIFGVLDISTSVKNIAFLQWCGRESIIIYVIQFAVIRSVKATFNSFFPAFQSSHFPYYIIVFIVAMVVLIPITWLSSKYLYFAFGRNKSISE